MATDCQSPRWRAADQAHARCFLFLFLLCFGGETEPALFFPRTRVACCGARSVLDEAHLPFAKAPAAPRLWVTPALLGLANGGELLGGLGSQLFEVSCVAAGLRGDCAICNFGCCIWPWLPTGRWLLHLHVAVHRGRGKLAHLRKKSRSDNVTDISISYISESLDSHSVSIVEKGARAGDKCECVLCKKW